MKTLASILVIICVMLVFSILINIQQKGRVDSSNKKLDSIQNYFNELDIIKKTIIISYPVVSEVEAKYYSYIFYNISQQYKVDFAAFPALIRIESNWNPTLVSSRKCRGLTQIASATASDGCRQFNVDYKEGVTEWNDILNVIIGLDYFSLRYKKNGLEYAIRSYIGGDGFRNAAGDNKIYIEKYTKEFMGEFTKVSYINKGVRYDAEKH